ncbi:hypothetical protein SBDP1_1600004 [Syntrophobacter sp. SbD1]|nr:hypothetical protein SBDP1_1600004 [Syntrophobacter sp. SbD1]
MEIAALSDSAPPLLLDLSIQSICLPSLSTITHHWLINWRI